MDLNPSSATRLLGDSGNACDMDVLSVRISELLGGWTELLPAQHGERCLDWKWYSGNGTHYSDLFQLWQKGASRGRQKI